LIRRFPGQVTQVTNPFALIEQGVRIAAASGADLVIAPELCISGYQFIDLAGTDWIGIHPDAWTTQICRLAKSLELTILFGHAERDAAGNLYNSAFMVDAGGMIVGHHRKINTHADQWSSAGQVVEPVTWNGLKVGMLICADAYTEKIAGTLQSKGAELLISPAAWGPGLYGPEGEWEQRTVETGLPLVVCNRTGKELSLDFSDAESLVIKNGKRLLWYRSPSSAVLTFDWSIGQMSPISNEFLVQRTLKILKVAD
jgi:predicted amidohydrolase